MVQELTWSTVNKLEAGGCLGSEKVGHITLAAHPNFHSEAAMRHTLLGATA